MSGLAVINMTVQQLMSRSINLDESSLRKQKHIAHKK
jgi:hypothetical protein